MIRTLSLILDCHGLTVTNGIFARRPADVLLLGDEKGVRTILRK